MLALGGEHAEAQDFAPWLSGSPAYSYPRAKNKVRHPVRYTRSGDDSARREKQKLQDGAGKHAKEDKAAKPPAGPLFGVVSLSDQRISIYNGEGLVARSSISTGMPGYRTPMGVFTIIQRNRWHRSNIYAGAPMPYMQRLTWSGVALHLGVVPGYPASHGCIRLPNSFAQQLWGMTKIGERVVVAPHDIAPVAFSHPLLPTPAMQPDPTPVSENVPTAEIKAPAEAAPGANTQVATTVAATSNVLPAAAIPAPSQPRLLNPIQYAQVLKAKAAADATAAAIALKEAVAAASLRSAEARRAVVDVRTAEAARAQAEARLAARVKALEAADTPEDKEAAEAAKASAEAELIERASKAEEARKVEANMAIAAVEAQRAWHEASAAVSAAEQAAKDAARRMSPISVLVSKKNKRVYIRQGLRPVLDAPATIRDPDIPLGTHVYIATASEADASAVRWSVMSLPPMAANTTSSTKRSSRAKSREERSARPEVPLAPPSNAAQALERIELAKEVSEQISELLWLGGSLIISDQPLSSETSAVGTDIVVTMR